MFIFSIFFLFQFCLDIVRFGMMYFRSTHVNVIVMPSMMSLLMSSPEIRLLFPQMFIFLAVPKLFFSLCDILRVPHLSISNTHEIHETCHSVTFYFMKKDSKRCCDTTTPESIHNKDESKCGSAFAFNFGVN